MTIDDSRNYNVWCVSNRVISYHYDVVLPKKGELVRGWSYLRVSGSLDPRYKSPKEK